MARPLSLRLVLADDDTIQGFERAAVRRFRDGESLRRSNRSLAAIYLYGYAVEMWIKAAYFRNSFQVSGTDLATKIGAKRREEARRIQAQSLLGRAIGPHEIEGWAQLLVAEREILIGPYPSAFADEIINRSAAIYLNWREYMRYRSNAVRPGEMAAVRSEANWFRLHYPAM